MAQHSPAASSPSVFITDEGIDVSTLFAEHTRGRAVPGSIPLTGTHLELPRRDGHVVWVFASDLPHIRAKELCEIQIASTRGFPVFCINDSNSDEEELREELERCGLTMAKIRSTLDKQ